jgi:hypothetical protein
MLKPVKAFSYQDHEAHIAVHMAAVQDPKIQQLLQQNPMANQIAQAMMAHVNEHIGFQYRVEIEKQMGMSLPPQQTDEMGEEEDVDISPQVEAQLSPMIAQAAQKLLQQNQQQAQQQAAAQKAADPLIQMQQQELQIKAQEQQRKAAKDQVDAQLKMKQLEIEQERIQSQASIAAQQAAMQAQMNVDKLKVARINKAGDIMHKASLKERELNHQKEQQAINQFHAAMAAQQSKKKETKE